MDFIKIPAFTLDSSGEQVERDAIIRISDIRKVYVYINKGKEVTTIVTNGLDMEVTTPMSVAKIYDLIWQTELSNLVKHKDE